MAIDNPLARYVPNLPHNEVEIELEGKWVAEHNYIHKALFVFFKQGMDFELRKVRIIHASSTLEISGLRFFNILRNLPGTFISAKDVIPIKND